MKVEEEYTDVLQNIEAGIVQTYKQNPQLLDYNVIQALEAAVARYKAEQRQQTPKPPPANERDAQVYQAIIGRCEWRLGRTPAITKESAESPQKDLPAPPPMSVDEILLCLKRLVKSAEFWNRESGRQGYLNYISHFVG